MKRMQRDQQQEAAIQNANKVIAKVKRLTIPVFILAGAVQVISSTSRPILLAALTLFQLLAFHSQTFRFIQYKYMICKGLKPFIALIHVLIYLARIVLLERHEAINIGFAVTVMIGVCFHFDVVGAVTSHTTQFANSSSGTFYVEEEDPNNDEEDSLIDADLLNKTLPISLLYIGTTAVLVQKQLYAEALGFIVALISVMSLSQLLLTILQSDYETTTRIMNELHEANAIKDKFVGNISHEFRSPLMSITASVSLLRMTGEISPEQDKHLATIDACGNVMLTLIDEVLRFAQIEEVMKKSQKQPFDLKNCLSKIESIIRPLARQQNVELKTEIDPNLPAQIIGDSIQLKHVAFALLTNAVKASPPHETVTFKVEKCHETSQQVTVKFQVSDKGTGIPEEKHTEVFKPFAFMIDNSSQFRRFPGAGLGLATSKKIIENMGGSISFSSSKQQGSNFTVTVPLEKISDLEHCQNVKKVFKDVARVGFHTRYMEHYNTFSLNSECASTSELDMMNASKKVQADATVPTTCLAPTCFKSTIANLSNCTSSAEIQMNSCAGTTMLQIPSCTTITTTCQTATPIKAVIAEDNIINRTVLTRLLQRCGYLVTAVSDGVELLEVCEKQLFDLVLTDYHMPRCNGVEAAKQLRKTYANSDLKIVLLTADALANVVEFQDIFDAILLKPISLPKLQAVLSEVLSKRSKNQNVNNNNSKNNEQEEQAHLMMKKEETAAEVSTMKKRLQQPQFLHDNLCSS